MKIKLCNIHKMTLANEGEERKPIHIPFGTWDYDETITQTLDKPHAEAIAADLSGKIAAGEPGIPVYQGHPDVPEYAGKYPDKGALGWVKKILVNEDGMDLFVDWDRDPGKGFGWFSPYWVGDRPTVGSGGKKNVIVDGLNSIGLVNNPNIREFRLANEAHFEERKPMDSYQLPQHIIDLANEYDESQHPRASDGKWTSAPGGGSTFKAESDLEKAISSKIGNDDVSVGMDGRAISVSLPSKDFADSALNAVREKFGDIESSKIIPHDDFFELQIMRKRSEPKIRQSRQELLRSTNNELESLRKTMQGRLTEARVGKMEGWKTDNSKLQQGLNAIAALHKRAILAGLKYSKPGYF